jgi:hypothetical protein
MDSQLKPKLKMELVLTVLAIGIVAGVFSGFIGVGGGIIVVPALVFFLGMSQHSAQGTSLAMMLPPIGIMAVYNYYKAGVVDFKIAAILCASFVVGSFFGSKIAISLNPDQLKKIFGIILILVGIKMVFWK